MEKQNNYYTNFFLSVQQQVGVKSGTFYFFVYIIYKTMFKWANKLIYCNLIGQSTFIYY